MGVLGFWGFGDPKTPKPHQIQYKIFYLIQRMNTDS